MLNRKAALALSAALFIGAVSAFGQTSSTTTTTITTSSFLPPVGLASSETVQVNLVNTSAAPATAAAGISTAPSCTGSVAFFNAGGSQIGTSTSFTIASGKVFSVTLPYASAGASGARTIVRAEIVNKLTLQGTGVTGGLPGTVTGTVTGGITGILTGTTTTSGIATTSTPGIVFQAPTCSLGSSLEIFDTLTGAIHAFIAGPSGVPVALPVASERSGDFSTTTQR